jgi:preprotein translocase subunit SecF
VSERREPGIPASSATEVPSTEDGIPGVTRRHRISDLYHEHTNFQFIKHSRRWLILSGTLILLSLVLVGVRGLNFGIDFKGGTEWQVKMAGGKHASIGEVRDIIGPLGFSDAKVSVLTDNRGDRNVRVQARVVSDPTDTIAKAIAKYGQVTQAAVQFTNNGAGGTFTMTTKDGFTPTKAGVLAALQPTGIASPAVTVTGRDVTVDAKTLPKSPVQEVATALAKYANTSPNSVDITTVGPTWGRDVTRNALKALIFFFLILAAYLTVRFEWKMSVAAIVAVIHDIIFTIGVYALFHFPVTPATVTAFLTILGFSLYDTVVVFDKVVEYQRSLTATGRATYGDMVNRSLNAVLMRSLSTSFVALMPVLSLLIVGTGILGATALEDFALALAAGLFIGSYSSIFVAAPILAWWKEKEPQYRSLADRRARMRPQYVAATVGGGIVEEYDDSESAEPVATATRTSGVAGPPAVPRGPIQPRARQQRRRKRR